MYRGDFFMSVIIKNNNKQIIAVSIGVLISVILTAMLSCVFALILNFLSAVPYGIIDYAVIATEGLSVFLGAYIAAAITKSRGMITGLIISIIMLMITVAFAMGSGKSDVGIITVIRAAVLIICGIGGGILGVNKKDRIRIH